ncbi:hypothetical protein BCC1697_004708 [Burkholderia gladioli]|uniref:TetR/AcrR family transcriptional regulator n=1 Tax=Burkholderia gladioli TaxID=28095 RepID=UPI0009BE0AA1|nr:MULTISPECIES: TetR/AcrR family transcriptional regulator [Burkholderia]NBI50436.1 TetR/AcrR family transcriptional regulator [Burkholderia sp. ISTR5]
MTRTSTTPTSAPVTRAEPAPGSRQSTILDAAERVFGILAYAGASMRLIADEAGVAQALLHYHYSTKDALYEAVFARRSCAINRYREQKLDALLGAPTSASLEDVLSIIFTPLSEIFRDEDPGTLVPYLQMLSAVSLGSDARSRSLHEQFYDPIAARFIDALHVVMPGLPHELAVWAYLFSVGARQQAQAMNGRAARLGAAERAAASSSHYEQLVRFAASGIRSLAHQHHHPVFIQEA